jgi:hypothetical protein
LFCCLFYICVLSFVIFLSFLFKLLMSEQEKVVSENSPIESDQSSAKTRSNDDLEDVMNHN